METSSQRGPSTLDRIVWVVLWFVLWFWAIFGPLGIIVMFVTVMVEGRYLSGVEMNRVEMTIAASIIGWCFAWLRLTDQLKFGNEISESKP